MTTKKHDPPAVLDYATPPSKQQREADPRMVFYLLLPGGIVGTLAGYLVLISVAYPTVRDLRIDGSDWVCGLGLLAIVTGPIALTQARHPKGAKALVVAFLANLGIMLATLAAVWLFSAAK